MRRLAADIIFPITSAPVTDAVLIVSDEHNIIGIEPRSNFLESEIEMYTGALVPGFINTHCHLELSHLKNVLPQKTGLIDFVSAIPAQRNFPQEVIHAAIEKADTEMWNSGISVVGDIANKQDTFSIKAKSKIHYHTFVELLAIDPAKASLAFSNGLQLMQIAKSMGINASLVPHAPYSVSDKLMQMIYRQCSENGTACSIHFLESAEENIFIKTGAGGFKQLYENLNMPLEFSPSGKLCVESVLPNLLPDVNTLLVHNTYADMYDVTFAETLHPNLFWCLCPNANMFIENRLPDVKMLRENVQYITIGTDSLASNHTLSVLDELQVLQKHIPELTTTELLRWATLYGAKFLNLEKTYGSFDTGKTPGVVNIPDFDPTTMQLQDCHSIRLI